MYEREIMPRHRDSEDQATVELAVEFTGVSTDLVYKIFDGDKEHWIPFSQTLERHGKLSGGPGTIVITEWIAKEKGLI
jgi:hypothetical protein